MKTPDEVARETMGPNRLGGIGYEQYLPFMVEAIVADRAQRSISYDDLDSMLGAWERYDGDVSGFMEAWLDNLNDGTPVPEWAS